MAIPLQGDNITDENLERTFQVRGGDEAPFYNLPNRTVSSNPSYSSDSTYSLYNALYDNKISNEETLKEFSPMYDLSEMCKTPSIEDGLSDEKFLHNWMENNFDQFNRYKSQDECHRVEIFTHFSTYLSSNNIKPDVFLFSKLIPLFLCEVHSTDYNSDVRKCVISLVYQLRALRHFDATINYVHGFVFPKRNKKQCATKVKVEWKDFKFYAHSWFLEVDRVIDDIDGVLIEQCKFANLKRIDYSCYFMPLSQSDLENLTQKLNCKFPLQQVESKFSILVKDKEFYYKLVPLKAHSDALKLFCIPSITKSKDISRLCLPIDVLEAFGQYLFKFELQPHQFLSMADARKCLKDLIIQALAALKQLHILKFAHNDLRLPNFVFSKDYELRLIDFDRCLHVDSNPPDSQNYFYVAPKKAGSAKSLDYKQLGMLILEILKPEYAKNNWKKLCQSRPDDFYKFLTAMIFYGDYDESLLEEFLSGLKDDYYYSRPLVDVLTKRTELDLLD